MALNRGQKESKGFPSSGLRAGQTMVHMISIVGVACGGHIKRIHYECYATSGTTDVLSSGSLTRQIRL